MNEPSEAARAIAANPLAQRADEFCKTFVPQPDVNYLWVEEYARKEYEDQLKAFDDLDGKAAAIINYLTSGAGLFTLGTLAGVATAKVSLVAAACALPSMVLAVLAIIAAAWGRRLCYGIG